jgi:hypothetical protein
VKPRIWLLLSLFACGLSWLYMSRVLLPWEYYIDVQHGRLIAQMGDLYPRWVGTRELLLNGRNPYSPEVSHEIQMAFYGHAIDQRYGQSGVEVVDEQRFVYPVYVVFLLAPTVHVAFVHLQFWAPVVFAVITAVSGLLWLGILRWSRPKILTAAVILFVLSSPQIIQGLRLRQLGLLVAFLLALSACCIIRGRLAIAGILLAISTVKPQMVVLPLAWFLFWSVGAWPRRWPLPAGFGITLATLIGLGELILPGWPRDFVNGLMAYHKYFPTTSLLCIALGNWVGGAVSGIVIVGLVALAWRNRNANAISHEFTRTMAIFFVAATLVLPLMTPFNQVLLLLPALMALRDWGTLPPLVRRVFAVVLAWPWMVSLVLLLLHPRLDSPNRLPLLPSALVLFLPFLLVMTLAIRRTWTNEPQPSAAKLRPS